MPLYEYQCGECEARFEMLRPMSRADEPAICPQGHPGAKRAISTFATGGRGAAPSVPPPTGGGGHGHSHGPGGHAH